MDVMGPSKLPENAPKRSLKEFKLNVSVTKPTIRHTTGDVGILPRIGKVEMDRALFGVVVIGLVGALIMLSLITFSAPLIPTLYFIETSKVDVVGAKGVVFGMWGWCLDENGATEIRNRFCTGSLRLGYLWNTQIDIPITRALIWYPVSALSTFFTLLALIPVHKDRNKKALKVFSIFTWISFTFSLMAFVFMLGVWGIVKERFQADEWTVGFGPLPFMSFVATLLLFGIAMNSWKGTLSRNYCLPHTSSPSSGSSNPGLRPLSLKSNDESVTSTMATENQRTTTTAQTIIQRIIPFTISKTKDRKHEVDVGDMEKGVSSWQRLEQESGPESSKAQRYGHGRNEDSSDTMLPSPELPQLPPKVWAIGSDKEDLRPQLTLLKT